MLAADILRTIAAGDRRVFNDIEDAGLVCIDDIGLREPTPPQLQALWEILTARERKPLVVSSNLAPEELAKIYDDRILSRLCCGTTIHVRDSDRRSNRAKIIEV